MKRIIVLSILIGIFLLGCNYPKETIKSDIILTGQNVSTSSGSKDNSGQAFPRGGSGVHQSMNGMTIKVYLVGEAVRGILSNPNYIFNTADELAKLCVDISDALLRELSK